MPRFFFDTDDGSSREVDDEGLILPSREAARFQALSALPDIARDEMPDGDRQQFEVIVRDEARRAILRAKLTVAVDWVTEPIGPGSND